MADLLPEFYIGDLCVSDYPFSVVRGDGGLDLGAGANVMTVVDSLLQDGEIETSSRTSNRTMVLPIYVEGADLAELATNEDILIQACEKQRNTFSLVPGDGFAPTTVFDTFRIQARHVRNDAEEAHMMRRWDLTIPALPWARSADLTTTVFTTGAATATTVDAASALTNWSSTSGTLSTATWLTDASVKHDGPAAPAYSTSTAYVTWAGTVPVANFVGIDIAAPSGTYIGPELVGTGVTLNSASPAAIERLSSGFTRFYFRTPTAGPLSFVVVGANYADGTGLDFYIGGLYSSATIPAGGVLVADVPGSVRSAGSLTVTRASGTLTNLMIYADPTMLSNGWQPGTSDSWPVAPAGRYAIYLSSSGLNLSDGSLIEGTVSANGYSQPLRTRTTSSIPGWVPLGIVDLGGNRDGRVGTLTFTLSHTPKGGTSASIASPKLRLLRVADDTSLIYHPASADRPLVVDAPSVTFPRGGVWAGGLDALANVAAWGTPVITPPMAALWVVDDTSTTDHLTVTLEHYATWHTYAGS